MAVRWVVPFGALSVVIREEMAARIESYDANRAASTGNLPPMVRTYCKREAIGQIFDEGCAMGGHVHTDRRL